MNEFISAIQELRKKSEKRKFNQSVDLIINLRDFDIKKQSLTIPVVLPFQIRESKICAFLEKDNKEFDFVIKKDDIPRFNPEQIKKLASQYDFFVSLVSLMPAVATTFGRILGPLGKMPNPKTGGVITDDRNVKELVQNLKKTVILKTKDVSIKTSIGKESMPDEDLAKNASKIYESVLAALPNRKENVKNAILKFTMSKPLRVNI
jgi:large subunit ribosomal protein L1